MIVCDLCGEVGYTCDAAPRPTSRKLSHKPLHVDLCVSCRELVRTEVREFLAARIAGRIRRLAAAPGPDPAPGKKTRAARQKPARDPRPMPAADFDELARTVLDPAPDHQEQYRAPKLGILDRTRQDSPDGPAERPGTPPEPDPPIGDVPPDDDVLTVVIDTQPIETATGPGVRVLPPRPVP
jgi:hypothetical protein